MSRKIMPPFKENTEQGTFAAACSIATVKKKRKKEMQCDTHAHDVRDSVQPIGPKRTEITSSKCYEIFLLI